MNPPIGPQQLKPITQIVKEAIVMLEERLKECENRTL
jgi:hypothetical protein